MINVILNMLIRFVLLVLFQVLVLNNIQLHGFITPFVYPLFILTLPLNTPRSLVLILAFIIGITVDIFSNTGGIHGLATIFIAFLRPSILRVLTPKDGYDDDEKPTPANEGFSWFFFYIMLAIFLHHFVFFMVEIMSLAYLKYFALKVLFSTLTSVVVIMAIQMLLYPKRRKRVI